ncbi:MAG: ABC transporter ATP-binding protein, partial [Acidimicrobiia bacterium]|nr:ABC transporter ATP-binding protein [Acidimicrobiia bacterium]
LRVGRLRASFEPAIDLLPNVGVIALLGFGSWRVSSGDLTTGDLVEAMALFGILSLPMRVLGYLLEEIPRAVVSEARLQEVLAADPAPTPDPATVEPLGDGPLGVEVRDVSYGPGDVAVVHDLSFGVSPGEVVALVGPTGSGKSTICNLLADLAEPWRGTIVVGGVELSRVAPAVRRDALALVFQESFLFADSVEENLTLGRPVEPERVRWATKVAKADAFIAALPEGAATVLGERGVTLSGGQRQRIALARALVRRPRLLLLDDATAAVDPRVEQEILARLRAELDTTTVVVAHRVSTIALADRVLYIDGGRLLAEGTHTELMATVPGYEALVRAYEDELDDDLDEVKA